MVGEQLARGNAYERNQRKCREHGAEHERCGKFPGVYDGAQRCERNDADDGEEHIGERSARYLHDRAYRETVAYDERKRRIGQELLVGERKKRPSRTCETQREHDNGRHDAGQKLDVVSSEQVELAH